MAILSTQTFERKGGGKGGGGKKKKPPKYVANLIFKNTCDFIQ